MKEDYIIGYGNVFKDLGFENPEDELAKVRLASIINEIIVKIQNGDKKMLHAGSIL